MKKISRLFFSVASAALISLSLFACSEPATDDNSFDPSDSIPENPPASVGEDPFKGIKFKSESETYDFDGSICVRTIEYNSSKDIYNYAYSWNTEKKELYLLTKRYQEYKNEILINDCKSIEDYKKIQNPPDANNSNEIDYNNEMISF